MTVILITASVTAVMAVLIRRGQIEEKRKIENRLNSSWGIQVPQLFSTEQMKSIRAFSDAASEYGILSETNGENFAVDDITAEDIDLDVLFGRIAGQASSPGREVLYAWLRHPLPSRRELEKRIEAENYFCEHEKERRDILRALYQTGSLKKGSFFEAPHLPNPLRFYLDYQIDARASSDMPDEHIKELKIVSHLKYP